MAQPSGPIIRESLALVQTAPPSGFENLLEPQRSVIDIYVDDALVGTAGATFAPGWIAFDDPQALAAMLPRLTEPGAVAAALTGRLDPHVGLICPANGGACPVLAPQIAGVVFDRSNFRAQIIIAPAFRMSRDPAASAYLPAPQTGLSLISTIAGSVSGDTRTRAAYNVQNRTIIGYDDMRAVGEFLYSDYRGFEVQTLSGARDQGGLRYQAGLFWSPPSIFVGQTRLYGASVGTQYDTRSSATDAYSDPIMLSLARRAQVEIYRDGRLIGTGLYDPGIQMIDTSNLPSGAYNVTLRIRENGSGPREEVRFFTKDRTMPPAEGTAFTLTGGTLAQERRRALPDMDDDLFLQATAGRRLSSRFAAEASAMLIDNAPLAEAGLLFLGRGYRLRAAALVAGRGNYGAIGEANWQATRSLSANAYVRKTWGLGLGAVRDAETLPTISPVDQVNLLVGNSIQAGGNVSWRLGAASLRFSGFYYDSEKARGFYSIGPSMDWQVARRGRAYLSFFGDARAFTGGGQAILGLRLRVNGPNHAISIDAGAAYDDQDGRSRVVKPVGGVLASYSIRDFRPGEVTASAGYRKDIDRETVRGETTLSTQYGRLIAQAEHQMLDGADATRYSVNFASSLVVNAGGIAVGGQQVSTSGVLVSLQGTATDAAADILVDNTLRGRITPGQSLPIFLRPYRTYSVRLVPHGGAALRFDTAARNVTLYSGNMADLAWRADALVAIFGRLVDEQGRPMANMILTGGGDLVQTDGAGYFQAELTAAEKLTIAGTAGCAVQLPPLRPGSQGFQRMGDVRCVTR